jgi:hypothetical protein
LNCVFNLSFDRSDQNEIEDEVKELGENIVAVAVNSELSAIFSPLYLGRGFV